jgi:hypothetical protein
VSETPAAQFIAHCITIEKAYEFMLAYAAQGLAGDADSPEGAQLREHLRQCADAMDGFDRLFIAALQERGDGAGVHNGFAEVIARDARDAHAAVTLVRAQASIGSQLIDNLNASVHLRALLTDLFLAHEVLKQPRT